MLDRLWCWLRGHDMHDEARIDNGRSVWGRSKCLRCGKEHDFQFDYNPWG